MIGNYKKGIPMYRVILMVLLTVVSESALAEWASIDVSTNKTTYADPASISRDGDLVILWTVDDFKTTQVAGDSRYLSLVKQEEFDCIAGTNRLLSYATYAGNFAKGGVVKSGSNLKAKTNQTIPNSFGEAKWKIACDKK